jgi:hypothetical protein
VAEPDQRRAHPRVGTRPPGRARPDGPPHRAPSARAAGAARRAAAVTALAAAARRRRTAADRAALHFPGAGARGGRAVRVGRAGDGAAPPGTRPVPAAHAPRARAARDGRGAAQRHQPGADADRPTDGGGSRGALAHRDRVAHRPGRRFRLGLHGRRARGRVADHHAERRTGGLRGAGQPAHRPAHRGGLDVAVGQQPVRGDPRRDPRAPAPAARPAADGRAHRSRAPRAGPHPHRDSGGPVGTAGPRAAPPPPHGVTG